MDYNRIKHSLAVANKMVEIGKTLNLKENELQDLFILGYNHDIGYNFCNDIIEHNKIGGEILKANQYKYWKEVYYHGIPNCKYKSRFLQILNMADMQIDKEGNDVGYEKRLEDIKNRHGATSIQFIDSEKLINELLSH